MNAYLIDAGQVDIVEDVVEAAGFPCKITRPISTRLVVFAPTRGQAKSDFIWYWNNDPDDCNGVFCDFEWTRKMSIKLVGRNIGSECHGIALPHEQMAYGAW